MNVKVVVGGIAAILVIAGVISAVAIVNDSGNKDNDAVLHDTWYLRYVEKATFVDDQGKPLSDVKDCKIESKYVDPNSGKMELHLTDIRNNIFQGTLGNTNISGRYDAHSVWFTAMPKSEPEHVSIINGAYDKDRLALSAFTYHIDGSLCTAMYLYYIHDVNSTVSPMKDRVEYNISYQHVYSKYHAETDFAPGGNPQGMESDIHHEYFGTHSMISLFKVLNGSNESIGVQAIVSLGYTPSGGAHGRIATYDIIDGEVYNLLGDVSMSRGKMNISQHMTASADYIQFVESEYNVPYMEGSGQLPGVVSGNYSGTVTSHYTDGTSSVNKISKKFTQSNRTIYAVEDSGTEKYVWFGTMGNRNGFTVEVRISGDDGSMIAGVLNGGVDSKGNIELIGVIHEWNSKAEVVVIYELSPVK